MAEYSSRFALPFLNAGQAQKEIAHNEALAVVDMLIHASAQSADLTAPPSTPDPGACWIVPSGATGAWSGHTDALAGWTAGGWRFATPLAGMGVRVADRDHMMVFTGSGWVDGAVRADGYYQDGERVVGAREGAIADPAGGAVTDIEGRAAIAAILAVLRAHGLIEV